MLRAAGRPLIPLLLVAAACLLGLIAAHGAASAVNPETYQVNTTAADPTGALNQCHFPQTVGQTCSLVAAINAANAHPNAQFLGPDNIRFQIAPAGIQTITPSQALPDILDPVNIDGTTQATTSGCGVGVMPCIRITGQGMTIDANATTVRGLAIYGTTNQALTLDDGANDSVVGNFLGTADGQNPSSETYALVVTGDSTNATIGGTTAADRNVISGSGTGILANGTNTTIKGNFIGTNAAGTAALGNIIGIAADEGATVTIGGTDAGAGNLISGQLKPNDGVGIYVHHASATILGNFIGTDVNGALAIGNTTGIQLDVSNTVTIGGNTAAARNYISGNGVGVLAQSAGTTISGNYIGTNIAGTAAIPNSTSGIDLSDQAYNAVVGGADGTYGNLISGNGGDGIRLLGHPPGGPGVTISHNYIGTNAAGTDALPNTGDGILLQPAAGAEVSESTIDNNLISGNGSAGIEATVAAGGGQIIHTNTITSNVIGLNAAGTAPIPNQNGVVVVATDSPINVVIDSITFIGNTISGNTTDGISVRGNGDGIIEPFFTSNFIGTNPAGTARIVNGLTALNWEDSPDGILTSNVIAGAGGQPAVHVVGNNTDTSFYENYIGTNPGGDNLGGQSIGILLDDAMHMTIGSETAPQSADTGIATTGGNVIRYSTSSGVEVRGTSSTNSIEANSIDDNGGLGIFLLGPQANAGQTAPVLAAAVTQGGSTHITGTLTSSGASPFTIEFFASPACDPSGSGEGRTYLGSTPVSTTANLAAIDATVSGTYPGQAITATATSNDGNTGQFSNCAIVPGGSTPTPTHSPTPTPTHSPTPTPIGSVTPTATPSGEPVFGDANCDGQVTMEDVIAALSQVAGVDPGAPCSDRSDVNCNGGLDADDALRIAAFVAGTPMTPPSSCAQVGT